MKRQRRVLSGAREETGKIHTRECVEREILRI